MATLVYMRESGFAAQDMLRTLDAVGEPYVTINVGTDMLTEDFLATYPGASLPFVIMNGVKFNDGRSLKEHLLNRPGVLYG